jgi:hypothetical protein
LAGTAATSPSPLGITRFVGIIFEQVRVESQFPRQSSRRETLGEQVFGKEETKGIVFRFETRQARKGKLDVRENAIALAPVLRRTRHVVHDAWRYLSATNSRKKREQAFLIGTERKPCFAAAIAMHTGQQSAVAKNKTFFANCRRGIERQAPGQFLESVPEIVSCVHRPLRISPTGTEENLSETSH